MSACLALGGAQGAALPERATALLTEARGHVEEALGREGPRTPDHPGWREALSLGRRALEASDDPVVHRFLARTYGLVGWSIRSLAHFDELLARGETLDDPPGVVAPEVASRDLYAAGAADLAFARYGAGDLDGAVAVYERWLAALPEDVEPLRWLGRLHLERLDPERALPYWERLAELAPDDEAVDFYLDEARRGVAVGPEAANAFRDGVLAYEAGELEAALERFETALTAAPSFADAAVWAGRTALELQRPALAVGHWERATSLLPDDAGAAYFLRVARDQARYGVTAGRAFHGGIEAYERGELEAAVGAFELAVAANDSFVDAWVWLARVRQELGRYDASVAAWERVTRLDPEDDRARYFLSIARQQRGVAAEAGVVFAEGIEAYERSDFALAEERFREAVELDPDAVQAWVWLGRLAFTLQRYDDAAEAFGRAAVLDPDDADIAFFAAEAAALAAAERAEEAAADDDEASGDDGGDDGDGDGDGDAVGPEGPP